MQQYYYSHLFTDVVKYLLIINVLFFAATSLLTEPLAQYLEGFWGLSDFLGVHYWDSPKFRPFQIVTHMFTHGGLMHIIFNMFGLVMFGSALEKVWGSKRFLFFYLFCGLGAVALQMAFYSYEVYSVAETFTPAISLINQVEKLQVNYLVPMVGASGAIYGVFLAFGLMYPNVNLYLIFLPIPIKAKYMVLLMFGLDLFLGIQQYSWDSFAHFAHLGGMISGFLLIQYWRFTDRNIQEKAKDDLDYFR